MVIRSFSRSLLLSAGLLTVPAISAQAQVVDLVAVSADGTLVTDLKADQLSVKVGGKDRAVTSLELVRFTPSAGPLAAPFTTNAVADNGREFVLVIDEESLRAGKEGPVRDAILALEQSLGATDRLGLFTVPRGSTSLAPTTDRGRFRSAVAAIAGRAKTTMSASEHRCHTRDVLTALTSVLGATGGQGTATPVVLFSTELVGPSSATSAVGGPEDCALPPTEFQRVGAAAEAAQAQFFLVRPEEPSSSGLAEGLEHVTGVAGGQMMFLGGETDGALARIARDTSGYYLVSFAADSGDRNGNSQRLEVRTTRSDVTLRARSGVVVPRAGRGTPKPQDMLRTIDVQRGFGLRSLTVSSRNSGDAKNDIKLVTLAEPMDASVALAAASAGVYDPTGKLIAQWTAKAEELKAGPIMAALAVPGGTYRVRMAAVDTKGRAATTDAEVVTDLTPAGPAMLGGLLVGTAGTSFQPGMRFSNESPVTVYFELYGRPEGPFGAIVEIAATPDGPALVEMQPTPAATPVADVFMFTATLPITSLPPGDYIVRAKIGFEGHPTGVLTRTIRKQ